MSDMIKEFYEKTKIPAPLLEEKVSRFDRNPDIAQEFEYWIEHRTFCDPAVEEHGYTAEKLSALSPYLNGEGAFALLIELRENPEKALARIRKGFKKK